MKTKNNCTHSKYKYVKHKGRWKTTVKTRHCKYCGQFCKTLNARNAEKQILDLLERNKKELINDFYNSELNKGRKLMDYNGQIIDKPKAKR